MQQDTGWKDLSNGTIKQYDFQEPAHWPRDRRRAVQAAILAAIEQPAPASEDETPGWLRLARALPDVLRAALIAELRAGNRLAGIGQSGWPSEGSIVVICENRFTQARRAPPAGVAWRALEDPRYYREQVHQTVGTVDFVLIT